MGVSANENLFMTRFLQKYQTVFNVEEQNLANIFTRLSTSMAMAKTTRKFTKKSTLISPKWQSIEEAIDVDFNDGIIDGVDGRCSENTGTPHKVTKKKSSGAISTGSLSSTATTETTISASIKEQTKVQQNESVASVESKQEIVTGNGKRKVKSKKSRKGETDHQNISVVSCRTLMTKLKLSFP